MAQKALITRGAKQTRLYLNRVQRRVPIRVGETMSKSAKVIKMAARDTLTNALVNQPGATGKLVSSIHTKRVEFKQNRRAWTVIVMGDPAKYADEIENGLPGPTNRPNKGKLADWKARVEDQSGIPVPVRDGMITVGGKSNPLSLHSRYPKGVKFMKRAFDGEVDNLKRKNEASVKIAIQ